MRPLYKGIAIAVLHVLLVTSLGAKLLYDRHTRPRAWAQTRPYDPNLPIRGRYLSLQLLVETDGFQRPLRRADLWGGRDFEEHRARLEVRNNRLVAVRDDEGDFSVWFAPAPGVTVPLLPVRECFKQPPEKQSACWEQQGADERNTLIDFPVVAVLSQPIVYFIPEHASDPTPWTATGGKELWAEVTLPRKGPPRPIQLALKVNGNWRPLGLR